MISTFIAVFVFSTVLPLVDVNRNEYYEGDRRGDEFYGGSDTYDREGDYGRSGYTGSGRYEDIGTSGYSQGGYHEGRGRVNGISERALEGGERKIHSMVENGVEEVLSKTGLSERKAERFAEMAADEAVKIAEREFRQKPNARGGSEYYNQREGYGEGLNSRNSANEGYYTRSIEDPDYGIGTNYDRSRNGDAYSYGGRNDGYGYGGSRRDEEFIGENGRDREYNNGGRGYEYRDQGRFQGNGGEYPSY